MINELNYDGINFPVSQKHYNKVEKQNSIQINVFGYEDGQPFPINISKETFEDKMNLLLITKDENKHCVLIKDFNSFMYNQSKHKERKHFCMYCLQCFSFEVDNYIELPTELRKPKKGLINIKNKDDECFRWCHIRHSNPQIEHPERIKKGDKQMINELNYDGIALPVTQKQYNKIETQNSIAINIFGYENKQPYPIISPKRHSKTK